MGATTQDDLPINTMRFLAVDAVQKANSGHPGTSAGAAPMAYVLWEASAKPEVILMGTGSEIHIALEAGRLLQEGGIAVRDVSLPSWELFDGQPEDYRNRVLPLSVRARISIEPASAVG